MHMLKRSKDVMTLLESYSSSRPDLQVTVCFLFGLINEERMRGLKEMFGWTISFAIKKFLLEWVKILTPTIFQIYLTWERSSLFQFLYETQDENFVKHALQDRTILLVRASSLMEPITTVYCLEHSFRLKHLGIQYDSENKDENEIDGERLILERETVDRLFKAVQPLRSNFKDLIIHSWNSTTILYEELAQVLIKNQRLKVLELDIHKGESTGMKILCQGLAHSECKVERLCLFQSKSVSCDRCILGGHLHCSYH
ncbi:NACHT, LRR and PYD domains-containing protein 3-like [Varanus komodoensis]|uniref:NACHT, LRR and PYD domains-containing protein 3-like n=1 Tax=Varanus komodoensis TaxID=61221 RepID=UPI001CF7E007|nr:NACHT, LRR and PYD domains-containing protein 3-like [Varanus komodoensis]